MTIASDPGRIARALRACVLFSGLDAPQLDRLIGLATEATWPEGLIVFREGEPDDRLYIVVEGLVALETHVPGRGRVIIQTIGPCEVLGWSSAVPGVETKTASARTLRPTRAIAIDAGALHTACEDDHHLGYHVYRTLARVIAGRLKATRMQLLDMYAIGEGL